MTPIVRCAVLAAALMTLAGCRQPDGEVPTPNETVQEELGDVTRDLQYIATGRDPNAANDLAEDLRKYARRETALAAVDELSQRTAAAVAGSQLTDEAAERLTHNLWLAIAALELSERQVEALQNETQALLVSVNVPEERAEAVAAQVGDVQRAVSDRPRRWYELF